MASISKFKTIEKRRKWIEIKFVELQVIGIGELSGKGSEDKSIYIVKKWVS